MTLFLIDEEKNPRWSPLVIFWLTKLGREADRHPCSARALEIKGTFRRAEKNKEKEHLESVAIFECQMQDGQFWDVSGGVFFFFFVRSVFKLQAWQWKAPKTQRLGRL